MLNFKSLIVLAVFSLPSTTIHADEIPSSDNKVSESNSTMQNSGSKSVNMQEHMKMMQALHEKMLNAKTPEEKQASMNEGNQMMAQCMAMMSTMKMGNMPGSDMSKRQEMMENRMDMMQMMMQMMMDRQEMNSATAKNSNSMKEEK